MDDEPELLVDLAQLSRSLLREVGDLDHAPTNARKLAESLRRVVGSPDFLGRFGILKTPADLASHEVIVHARDGREKVWAFRRGTAKISVAVSGHLRVSVAEGVRAAVLAGMGLAAGSDWMFGDQIRTDRLVPVLLDWSLPPTILWAVFPPGRMASAKALAFASFVVGAVDSPVRSPRSAEVGGDY